MDPYVKFSHPFSHPPTAEMKTATLFFPPFILPFLAENSDSRQSHYLPLCALWHCLLLTPLESTLTCRHSYVSQHHHT